MNKEHINEWNSAAMEYANSQQSSPFAKQNMEVVAERFHSLQDKKVLDLGCGFGNYTEYFSSIGADTIGCDGSVQMIKIAKEKYPKCSFSIVDIEKGFPFNENSFDMVFCNQVLMDIEEIDKTIAETARVLKKGGIFYCSIVHPAFYDAVWDGDSNFLDRKIISKYLSVYSFKNNFWGATTHFHRPISFYINKTAEHGFLLKELIEPSSYDNIMKSAQFPLFLFMEFLKA